MAFHQPFFVASLFGMPMSKPMLGAKWTSHWAGSSATQSLNSGPFIIFSQQNLTMFSTFVLVSKLYSKIIIIILLSCYHLLLLLFLKKDLFLGNDVISAANRKKS